MTGRVVVVGLGPGDPAQVSVAALGAIERIPTRYLRTTRHPSAGLVGDARSFDHLYESAGTVEEVYTGIVDALVAAAAGAAASDGHGEVLYAVPGSPLVAERTVELLRADPRVEVEVIPALSFLDLVWDRVGVDPVAAGVRLVDGHRFAVEAAGERGPMLVAQTDTPLVLSDVKLAVDDGPEVLVLQRLGLPDEAVTAVAWDDLDREVRPDHLTCVWVPALAAPVAGEVARLAELVRTLRERCPWDRRQTHRSLTRHLLEETYEVLEAIDELDRDGDATHLEEELGDLLFQVVFHASLAAEAGAFTLADVAAGIHDKLVRRHPHVFEGAPVGDWEAAKAAERGGSAVMDGVPGTLPALLHAAKVQGKAASLGLGVAGAEAAWTALGAALDDLRALDTARHGAGETGEREPDRRVHDAAGAVLLALVDVARLAGVDPETALRDASEAARRAHAAAEAAGRTR